MASEHYHDLLWDYLYGLLDQTVAEIIRTHVEICSDCRAALKEAEGQRHLLARAAKVIQEVPLFNLPGQNEEPAPAQPPSEVPPVLPIQQPRRSTLRRYWPAWAAAAALLAVAFGLNTAYQNKLASQEAEVARVRNDVLAIDGQFASLRNTVERDKLDIIRLGEEKAPPQMQVFGPAQVQADAPANLHVETRDEAGQLRAATITTSVLDAANGSVLSKQVDRTEGDKNIQVKVDRAARIVLEAKDGKDIAKIEETLQLSNPVHSSHLALNKSLYNVGEVLFFRSLTLDRYTLKPPAQPVSLRFSLNDANGRPVVKDIYTRTVDGGISGGELALTPNIPSGMYSFQLSGTDAQNAGVLPQSRSLEIVRPETPLVVFGQKQYKGGETMEYSIRGGNAATNTGNAPTNYKIFVKADGQLVPPGPNQGVQGQAFYEGQLDRLGNSSNLQSQLPKQIKKAEVVVDLKDGAKESKFIQSIPIQSTERVVEFFPEGGDLVAGMANRVYYRVRSPQGDPILPEGKLQVFAGQKFIADSEPRQGLGTFTFTPDIKETYSVRIACPDFATEIKEPFQKRGILPQGLVLHAPQSVFRVGEIVSLVLRNQGGVRRVLLQTTCRGQIVGQQYLDMAPGSKEVKLQTASDAIGVLRVTALEVLADKLVPVAERLLFRVPEKRLEVACQIANGNGPLQPGTNVTMKLKTTDELKNAGPVWMLAAVVDENYRLEKSEIGLPAQFYLAGDLGSDGLENAHMVVNDDPASRQALDLFLGTQGWRRFTREEGPTFLAMDASKPQSESKARAASTPGFFIARNNTPPNLKDIYRAEVGKDVNKLIEKATRERRQLIEQKEISTLVLDQAVRELAEVQRLPRVYFRLALGILTLALLLVGGVFLAIGLLRLLRNKENSPTACFTCSLVSLFACLLLFFVGGSLIPLEDSQSVPQIADLNAAWPEFTFDPNQMEPASDKRLRDAPAPSTPPQGVFLAQAMPPLTDKFKMAEPRSAMKDTVKADDLAKRSEGRSLRTQNSANNSLNLGVNGAQGQLQNPVSNNAEMSRRYIQSATNTEQRGQGQGGMPAPAAMAKTDPAGGPGGFGGGGGFAGGAAKTANQTFSRTDNYLREYAHRSNRQAGQLDLQNTLLWHPTLFSPNGEAQVSFDLSQNLGKYRILLYANSPSGRLGFYEGQLEVGPTK